MIVADRLYLVADSFDSSHTPEAPLPIHRHNITVKTHEMPRDQFRHMAYHTITWHTWYTTQSHDTHGIPHNHTTHMVYHTITRHTWYTTQSHDTHGLPHSLPHRSHTLRYCTHCHTYGRLSNTACTITSYLYTSYSNTNISMQVSYAMVWPMYWSGQPEEQSGIDHAKNTWYNMPINMSCGCECGYKMYMYCGYVHRCGCGCRCGCECRCDMDITMMRIWTSLWMSLWLRLRT